MTPDDSVWWRDNGQEFAALLEQNQQTPRQPEQDARVDNFTHFTPPGKTSPGANRRTLPMETVENVTPEVPQDVAQPEETQTAQEETAANNPPPPQMPESTDTENATVKKLSPYEFSQKTGIPLETVCFVELSAPLKNSFGGMMSTLIDVAVDLEMMRRGDAPVSAAGLKAAYDQVEGALELAGLHKDELTDFVENQIQELIGEEDPEASTTTTTAAESVGSPATVDQTPAAAIEENDATSPSNVSMQE